MKRKMSGDHVVRKVNSKKRPCLFKELLRAIDPPDLGIVDDLEHGFMPTGWMNPAGIFPKSLVPPQMLRPTTCWWRSHSRRSRRVG